MSDNQNFKTLIANMLLPEAPVSNVKEDGEKLKRFIVGTFQEIHQNNEKLKNVVGDEKKALTNYNQQLVQHFIENTQNILNNYPVGLKEHGNLILQQACYTNQPAILQFLTKHNHPIHTAFANTLSDEFADFHRLGPFGPPTEFDFFRTSPRERERYHPEDRLMAIEGVLDTLVHSNGLSNVQAKMKEKEVHIPEIQTIFGAAWYHNNPEFIKIALKHPSPSEKMPLGDQLFNPKNFEGERNDFFRPQPKINIGQKAYQSSTVLKFIHSLPIEQLQFSEGDKIDQYLKIGKYALQNNDFETAKKIIEVSLAQSHKNTSSSYIGLDKSINFLIPQDYSAASSAEQTGELIKKWLMAAADIPFYANRNFRVENTWAPVKDTHEALILDNQGNPIKELVNSTSLLHFVKRINLPHLLKSLETIPQLTNDHQEWIKNPINQLEVLKTGYDGLLEVAKSGLNVDQSFLVKPSIRKSIATLEPYNAKNTPEDMLQYKRNILDIARINAYNLPVDKFYTLYNLVPNQLVQRVVDNPQSFKTSMCDAVQIFLTIKYQQLERPKQLDEKEKNNSFSTLENMKKMVILLDKTDIETQSMLKSVFKQCKMPGYESEKILTDYFTNPTPVDLNTLAFNKKTKEDKVKITPEETGKKNIFKN